MPAESLLGGVEGRGFIHLMSELECRITQMHADARVQRIYGDASEIMKEIIARSLQDML